MKFKSLFLCVLFAGCAELPDENTSVPMEQTKPPLEYIDENTTNKYYGDELIKNVNHYAKWLTQDLFSNIDFPSNNDIYVVANFALLDSDLTKTNHFGRQMTEAIIHEVHNTGFSVIDLKASGFIRMTETGDVFYQTEDYLELSPTSDASHIITGTMAKHQGGYIVNAKVVLLADKSLVSTAQIFVPHQVVDAVMLEEKTLKENTQTAPKETMPKKTTIPLRAYSQ